VGVRFPVILIFLATLTSQLVSQGARWPDFRGPTRDGHAPAARVPLRWSETHNVRWKVPIPGVAWSSPVVWDGQVWMTTASPKGHKMGVVALDVATGKKLHERLLIETEKPEEKNPLNSYASPTPAIEEGRIYVHFGSYGTACLDTKTGKTVWERSDLPCDHATGPGSSPILYKDLLIFHMDGRDVQYVVALDKKTGKTRWKTPRTIDLSKQAPDMRRAFSTPIVIDVDGAPRLVSTGSQATYLYEPETGKEVWRLFHKGFSQSSRPVQGDGLLFLNTGYVRPQLLAVRPGGQGDVTDKDAIAWTFRRSVPTMPSALFIDGLIYMVSDGGVASCVEAKTGKSLWRERIGGEHSASPVFVNGRIYFFDREGGSVVIAPGPEFKKLAENTLESGCMASAAVVGDAFLLRTKKHLYRLEKDPE